MHPAERARDSQTVVAFGMAVCAQFNRCHWLVALAKTAPGDRPRLPLQAPQPGAIIYNCSTKTQGLP